MKAGKKLIIKVIENPIGYAHYYHTNFPLYNKNERGESQACSYAYVPKDDKLKNDFGEIGAKLWIALFKSSLSIKIKMPEQYILDISKISEAYTWQEIEGVIFQTIEKIYGKIRIKRENILLRFCYLIRRNILYPLFPKLYK